MGSFSGGQESDRLSKTIRGYDYGDTDNQNRAAPGHAVLPLPGAVAHLLSGAGDGDGGQRRHRPGYPGAGDGPGHRRGVPVAENLPGPCGGAGGPVRLHPGAPGEQFRAAPEHVYPVRVHARPGGQRIPRLGAEVPVLRGGRGDEEEGRGRGLC